MLLIWKCCLEQLEHSDHTLTGCARDCNGDDNNVTSSLGEGTFSLGKFPWIRKN